MGVLGRLFGTEKAVDNVLNSDDGLLVKFGGWVNGLHQSDEEKTAASAATREWGIEFMKGMAPFKVVQRILVFSICGVWVFVALNLVGAIWLKACTSTTTIVDGVSTTIVGIDAASGLWELALSDYVFWPAILAFSLYLSGGVIKPGLFGGKK